MISGETEEARNLLKVAAIEIEDAADRNEEDHLEHEDIEEQMHSAEIAIEDAATAVYAIVQKHNDPDAPGGIDPRMAHPARKLQAYMQAAGWNEMASHDAPDNPDAAEDLREALGFIKQAIEQLERM